MRTRNLLKYVLASIVALGTAVTAVADEAMYKFNYESQTVELQTIQAPAGTSVKLRGSDFTRATNTFSFLSDNYRDRVYLPNGQDEYIDFTNFRYEVTAVKMYVMANPNLFNVLESNIYASLRDYKDVNQNNSFRIGVLQGNGLDFHEINFINTAIAPASGLKLLYLKGTSSGNPAFFRGSNNTTSPTFKVIYNKPDVRIRFANGKKGYDIGIGESNAEIEGYISDHAGAFVVGQNNLHFEYESSDNSIATFVNKTSGKITALSEGDVTITAKLMEGDNEISSYPYTLHVFGKDEGLEWQREEMFRNGQKSGNPNEWTIGNTANSNNEYDWVSSDYLKVNTTIWENSSLYQSGSSRDNWKQVVSLTTPISAKWRAIAQKVVFKMLIPKYTTAEASFNFAANFTIGEKKGNSNKYGYEVVDFGEVSSEEALSSLKNIKWDTKNSDEDIRRFSDITILRNGADNYTNFVGSGKNGLGWICDNKDGEEATSMQRYLAVMAYLHNNHEYPGEVSVGYKNIPTYKYYAYIHYYANYKEVDDYLGKETMFATGKSESISLNRGNVIVVPNRPGYTLLGWSHDKNATMAEYAVHNAFIPYDSENGGGKGNITLYAVWKPNDYIVTLNQTGGGSGTTSVTVTFDAPMPSGDDVKAPTRYGYTFGGYYAENNGVGEQYYTSNMSSAHNWDIAANTTLYAKWTANVCQVELRPNGTNAEAGTPYVMVTHAQKFPEEVDGYAIIPPTRKGYNFNGFYLPENGNKKYFYDKDMKTTSCATWPYQANYYVLADWTPKTTEITFDPQGGNGGPGKLIATYDQSLPNAWAPNHSDYGYEFKGYFTEPEGRGKQYYSVVNNNVVGIGQWDRQDASIILYAYWTPKTYTLTLKHNDGTNVEDKVQVTYTQSMPDAPKPSRLGYEFEGYYRWDNTQFYDKDMNSVQPWDLRNDSYLEAHWIPIKYVLTLNAGSNTVIPTTNFGNGTHSYTVSEDRTTITMNVSLDENLGSFYNGVPKKPGFKFVGFYVGDILVAAATGDKGRNLEFTNNAYINNSVWKYTGNLTLTARWIPKYTLSDNVLTFNDGEYLEVGKDWQSGKVNDLLGATEYEVQQGNISSNNPVMAFDIRNAIYLDGSSNNADDLMQSLQNKSYISPNALVYVGPDAYSEVKVNNVIRPSGQGDEAKFNNLVVTDRYPIKIIDDFTAQTAAYRRNQAQVGSTTDGMWTQSSGSRWGTLCLPFEIKNMAHGIQFYELRDIHDGAMCFYELPADYVLPANTPIVYKRMSGAGSDISVLVNSQVNVGENKTYATNDIYYNNAPNAKPTIKDWEFRGTLQEVVCCGKDYQNPPANAWVIVNKAEEEGEAVPQDVYYFKQDTFTRLGTKTKATCLPYRAYFYRTSDGHNSQSKDSSFSILVMDENGATDITGLLDSKEVKANGKIYDLSGRRVMQPVKGRLYIVDGKKKVY